MEDEGEDEERLKMVERAIHRLIDDEKKKKKKSSTFCYSNSNRRKDEVCNKTAAAEEVYFDAAALADHDDSCQPNLVAPAGEGGDGTLLIKLLNQLASVKAEPGEHSFSTDPEPDHVPEPELETPTKQVSDEDHIASGNNSKDVSEEIVKELRIVKRQNRTTHCLLSVLLAATLLWQFSEVSLLFIMKEKVSHPFKSIGSFIKGSLKNAFKRNKTSRSPEDNGPIEVPSLPLPQLSTSLTSDSNE